MTAYSPLRERIPNPYIYAALWKSGRSEANTRVSAWVKLALKVGIAIWSLWQTFHA
ncbi:hypothetical protein [Cryobacterium sp. GrIS_2_6]|uniref:hypothetical protein n=1 Tax=Cryobacterium sp. GrIS_2_6 TaxID=3162785 RepID=UPI002E0B0B8C|nr:hypothetical protein [Cryobacterium psychrotolerans]